MTYLRDESKVKTTHIEAMINFDEITSENATDYNLN